MNIRAGLGEYILQTHNTKTVEDSMGGGRIETPKPSLGTQMKIMNKCVPVLLYGLEACRLNKSQFASLDFVANRFIMKPFNICSDIETVQACQKFLFGFALDLLYCIQWSKRAAKFAKPIQKRLLARRIYTDIVEITVNELVSIYQLVTGPDDGPSGP